ncbi:MAG TPA: integrase core domain-containing protein [Methylocella sp.]|nr:integrase core domain-containing protein [Methylocella sp.]
MQVFGLPSHIIRNGRAASRLLAAKTPNIEAARRHDAVQRWRRAMADGLTAGQAARAVGVSRATLYRWQKKPEPLSRRPHRPRGRQWTSGLARAIEELRSGNPMWGKRKIAVLLRREGFACSVSTVGRILAHLVKRGAVVAVPILRRRPAAKRIRLTAKERYARRLPKGRKAKSPGELVQIDTLFVNVSPDRAVKHFTAYDPVAKWTIGRVCTQASASSAKSLLDKLLTEAPFPVRGIQVDGGSEFKSVFEAECQARGIELFVLPPKRPDLNGCVERAQSTWRYEFYAVYDLPHQIDKLQAFVDAFAYRFNHHRPHDALGGRTPAEYLQALSQGGPSPSHRS